MKKILLQNQVVDYFKERYIEAGYDHAKAAEDFISKYELSPESLSQFEDTTLRLSMNEYFGGLEFMQKLIQFTELNRFIISVKTSLGYKHDELIKPGEAFLEKMVDPPHEALTYVGHNKLDVSDSKHSYALTYK